MYAFTGREWDKDVDLQYNRMRWYDPVVGRWISEDPIGFAGGDANLVRYVGNNPVNWEDPSGLSVSTSGDGAGDTTRLNWSKEKKQYEVIYDDGNGGQTHIGDLDGEGNITHDGIKVSGKDINDQVNRPGVTDWDEWFRLKKQRRNGDTLIDEATNGIGNGELVNLRAGDLPTDQWKKISQGRMVKVAEGVVLGGVIILMVVPSPGGRSSAPKITKQMQEDARIIATAKEITREKLDQLVRLFGGRRRGWVKKSSNDQFGREVHWYQHDGIGNKGEKFKGEVDPF